MMLIQPIDGQYFSSDYFIITTLIVIAVSAYGLLFAKH